MNTSFIYGLTIKGEDKPFYIGKSINPAHRFYGHLKCAKSHKSWLYNKIRKIQKEGNKIEYIIIDEVPTSEWKIWEMRYILLFKSFGARLYNMTNGGNGEFTKDMWEMAKKICSKPIFQYDFDGKFIKEWESIAEATRGVGLRSTSSISSALTGVRPTAKSSQWRYKTNENTPLFIGSAQLLIDINIEAGRLKTIKGLTGKKHSASHLENMRKCRIGVNVGKNHFKSIPVQQLTLDNKLIRYWESRNLAATTLGINQARIRVAVFNSVPAGGFNWQNININK